MQQIRTTLNKSLADFTYKDSSMVQILKQTLENLEFQGITVKLNNVFLEGSHNVALLKFYQVLKFNLF